MPTKTLPPEFDARVWERVISFEGESSPTAARALLKLQFARTDQQRMHELATKARAGTLSPDEERLIDTYERLRCLLDILHSKARRALKRRKPA
jgi:hypothetical protein